MNRGIDRVNAVQRELKGKHIFILGAGVMQIPAIEIAREMGLHITVADGNPEAEGRDKADVFLHIDLKDTEALYRAARNSEIPVDGVFTAGTDFSASVAYVVGKLGLHGISHETAMKATDKALMREAFADAGVPSPKFVYFTLPESGAAPKDVSVTAEDVAGLKFPLVVKPVDNMGARGIRRVDTLDELTEAVKMAFPLSRKGRVIVEEYIEGAEYSVDALIWNGEIYICGIADRHITFPPFFIEMGHTMPTASSAKVRREIVSVFKQGIAALGIFTGAAKGDIKYNEKGAFIGEIAARLSGGYMSGWTYPYASGILPTMGGLRIALGYPPFDSFSAASNVSAEHAYISVPGRVRGVSGIQEALTLPYLRQHFSRVKPGDRIEFPRNNVEKCGNYISQAPSRKKAVQSVKSACRNTYIDLEPDDPSTLSFLTERGHSGSYFGNDKKLYAYFERMQLIYGFSEGVCPSGLAPVPSRLYKKVRGWYGDSAGDVLKKLGNHGIMIRSEGCRIGKPAWLSLARGGLQGSLWFFETLALHYEKGDLEDWLRNWE